MTVDVEIALRRTLADRAAALPGHPDPWPRFSGLERRHRVGRRARIGGVAAAGMAALGLVGTGVVPLPSWVPALTVAPASSPLLDQPTVGSLAADTGWIDTFRQRVPDLLADTWASDSDGHWKVTGADDVRVLFAGDVDGQRLVLAAFPLRLGLVQVDTAGWFTGPVGASPQQMEEEGSGDLGRVASRVWAEGGRARVLAIAPAGSTVDVATPPVITTDGAVEQRWQPMTRLATGELVSDQAAPSPVLRVTWPDGSMSEEPVGLGQADQAGWAAVPTDLMGAASQADAGARLTHDEANALFAPAAAELAQLGVGRGTADIELVWLGGAGDGWQALVRAQVRGGGVVVVATSTGAPRIEDDGSKAQPVSTDLVAVAPAAGAAGRPYAWRRLAGDGEPTTAVTVVAPPGTARLELAVGDQPAVDLAVARQGGGGHASTTVPLSAEADVLAYDAAGRLLGRTPLTSYDQAGDALELPRLGPAR